MEDKYRTLKLNNPSNVRDSLAKVTRMMLAGEIDIKKCNSFGYMSNLILQSIRIDEQEKAIEELQSQVEEMKKQNEGIN